MGKEYKLNGELKFEGEYKEGKRWNGNGIEFIGDKILFEGLYKNGEKWNGKEKNMTLIID